MSLSTTVQEGPSLAVPLGERPASAATMRFAAMNLLVLTVLIQLSYFVLVVMQPALLVATTLALAATMMLVIMLLPAPDRRDLEVADVSNILPLAIIAIALFKIASRSDVYLASLTGGINLAREVVAGRGSTVWPQTLINVLLTPLWINLVALKIGSRRILRGWTGLAVGIVPMIGLLDMYLFGARVTLAYQLAILFVAGVLGFRIAVAAALTFVGIFIYVQASRSSAVYELGFEYLSLTASGRTLPLLKDLSKFGAPDGWVGVAVFFQYIAHSVSELTHLVANMPFLNLTFATILDQMAVVGFGDRTASQALLAQTNPGNGAYQTFFGVFIVDFGFVGILVALFALAGLIILAYETHGQVRSVVVLMAMTNTALAPIENFFVVGAGLIYFILTVALAALIPVPRMRASA